MIVSPFALWFIIGAVVGIFSVIDDVFISKNKEVLLRKFKEDNTLPLDDDKLYKLILCTWIAMDTLFGPVAIWGFYKKTKKIKELKAEYFGK
ncbi:hypothetical protein MT068_001399 [Salmonella enterica]|nr:hypothetical protein [Salmonella enterica]